MVRVRASAAFARGKAGTHAAEWDCSSTKVGVRGSCQCVQQATGRPPSSHPPPSPPKGTTKGADAAHSLAPGKALAPPVTPRAAVPGAALPPTSIPPTPWDPTLCRWRQAGGAVQQGRFLAPRHPSAPRGSLRSGSGGTACVGSNNMSGMLQGQGARRWRVHPYPQAPHPGHGPDAWGARHCHGASGTTPASARTQRWSCANPGPGESICCSSAQRPHRRATRQHRAPAPRGCAVSHRDSALVSSEWGGSAWAGDPT